MKEFEIVPAIKIKRKGVFNLSGLYEMMEDWLDFNGLSDNLKETEYIEKTTPGGKEIAISWETYFDVNSYVRFKIKITFNVIGLIEVELQKGHKKVKRNKGTVEIKIEGKVVYDPEDKYKKNIITFPFMWFYELKMKNRLEGYKLELYKKLYTLQKEIKIYLDMHEF